MKFTYLWNLWKSSRVRIQKKHEGVQKEKPGESLLTFEQTPVKGEGAGQKGESHQAVKS